ncbi:MAG: AtpZ/AtpI family protein [Syntrophaceae bacterium]
MKTRATADAQNINQIIMVSAWSFTIVVSSLLFLYIGRRIDVSMNTEPAFMIGLMVLGISLCIMRLYKDYAHMSQHLARPRQRRI